MTMRPILGVLALLAGASVLTAGSCTKDIGDGDQFSAITVRVSTDATGAETAVGATGAHRPSVSADGRLIAFESDSPNLVPGDANGVTDIFVKDRNSGAIEIVSTNTVTGVASLGDSSNAALSSDGRWVVFESAGNLDLGFNTHRAIYRHDRTNHVTRRVTTADFDQDCFEPSVSDDGRFVAFRSTARFDLNQAPSTPIDITAAGAYANASSNSQVFVADMQNATADIILVSRISGGGNEATGGNGQSDQPRISRDGTVVVFRTAATNLFADTNGSATDIVLSTRSGVPAIGDPVVLISVNTLGTQAAHSSSNPSPSKDGRFVAFTTVSSTILGGAVGIKPANVVLRDRQVPASTIVVSLPPGGGTFSTVGADHAAISENGDFIAFETADAALVGGGGVVLQIALWSGPGLFEAVSVHKSLALGTDISQVPSVSSDGRFVAFESLAINLIAGDGNGLSDIFVRGPLR